MHSPGVEWRGEYIRIPVRIRWLPNIRIRLEPGRRILLHFASRWQSYLTLEWFVLHSDGDLCQCPLDGLHLFELLLYLVLDLKEEAKTTNYKENESFVSLL